MQYNTNYEFPKQFSFAKSLSGQYLFVSESFAEVAGFDSPGKMIGLTDTDLFWKKQAELYSRTDIEAFKGRVLANHPQLILFAQEPNKIRRGLETKTALRDKENNIIGVIGSTIDITEHHVLQKPGQFDAVRKKFIVKHGPLLGLSFSRKQVTLLQYIIMGHSAAEIGLLINRSKRTIEGHIEHLKNKLQCTSKAEIIRCVVTSGLLHGIDWPTKQKF